jgi:hypothetical protein
LVYCSTKAIKKVKDIALKLAENRGKAKDINPENPPINFFSRK